MDGNPCVENDYRIKGILRKNNITDEDVDDWVKKKSRLKDVVLSVSLSVWRRSLDPRYPSSHVDAVIFAHNKNHSIAIEIQNHFQKILFQLEPKVEIFSKESWTPVNNGSLLFKTNDGKEVSASLGFLVVTPEFCTEEWKILVEQPFFQRALYDKDVTIVPVLVNNPRQMKEKIPLGIKCLRSVDFYNKDDIISHKTVETFLKPVIKSRVSKENEELKNHIYWLYRSVIVMLPEIKEYNHQWSHPQHNTSRLPSQDDSDYYSRSPNHSYCQQSSSTNGKEGQTTGQGFNSDSAYGSDEQNSQWTDSTDSAPHRDGDKTSQYSNQPADDTSDLSHAPSLNLRSLSESFPPVKSHKHKTHSPLQRDIGEQRSSNGTSSPQDETDIERHFSHTTKPNTTTTSSCSNLNFGIQKLTKSNALFNTQPASEHLLPVAVEVECNNLLTLSSHNSNIPSKDIQDASEVPNSNLSSRSSSIDQRNRSNSRKTTQKEFKQSPTPQPVNVSNTLWNSHSITSSRSSSHKNDSLTDSENIDRSAFNQGPPQPQPLHVQFDKLPSVDLSSHDTSTSEPPSNHSAMSRRSVSDSFHLPSPREIFINSFPSEVEQTNTSNLASFKTAPLPARDVKQLPLGCFRPLGDHVSAPLSGYWDSRREKMVNVVKPFSSLNHHHEDDDDDDEDDVILNDLSLPDTHAEETIVKQTLQ